MVPPFGILNSEHSYSSTMSCESGFETGRSERLDLRKYKKNVFLQLPSRGEQARLGPCNSIGNTADSVFLQHFYVNTCSQSL